MKPLKLLQLQIAMYQILRYDDGYFPFDVFMSNCIQLCYNELVLTYPIELVDAFFGYDAEKQDKGMAIHLVSYCNVPLVKIMPNDCAMIIKSL